MVKKTKTKVRKCGVCENPIPKDSARRLYCSPACAEKKMKEQLKALTERRRTKAAAEKLPATPCPICSVPFVPFRKSNKYCSPACAEKGFERVVEAQRRRRAEEKAAREEVTT